MSSLMNRLKEVIQGYRSQVREPCRFKDMAVSERVYEKYSRGEILRTWGRLEDTVHHGVTE